MIGFFNNWKRQGCVALVCATALVQTLQVSATDTTSAITTESPTEHIVLIENLEFSPNSLTVKVGDTITWVNNDFIPHTATAQNDSWDSNNLDKGDKYSLTVTSETATEYFCRYHPNMMATLQIID